MQDFEFIVPVIAILGAFAVPIISILMYWVYEIRKVGCEAALKQEMIARGYSANEIVHVLTNGKLKSTSTAFDLPPAKLAKAPSV